MEIWDLGMGGLQLSAQNMVPAVRELFDSEVATGKLSVSIRTHYKLNCLASPALRILFVGSSFSAFTI